MENKSAKMSNKLNLQPQSLSELKAKKGNNLSEDELNVDCIICDQKFDINDEKKLYLAHLISAHQVVIADVKIIGHFKKYTLKSFQSILK